MKNICILLAAYNGSNSIREQINTGLYQKNVKADMYISVDISNDDTLNICKDYLKVNDSIKLLPYGERFGGAGKNFYRLLKDTDITGYDYIAFSDQDDLWPQDKLAKAIEKLQDYDCYSANVIAFWEDGREILVDKSQPQRRWDFLFEAAGPGCTYVFRKKFAMQFKTWLIDRYDKIGENIALHDWLIYAFARSHGYSWFIDPNPRMRYRQHSNNQIGTNNNISAAIKRLRLIKKKWYRHQVINITINLGLEESPIYKYGLNNGYFGNLYLLLNIGKLRRRLRDRIALAIVLLFNIF